MWSVCHFSFVPVADLSGARHSMFAVRFNSRRGVDKTSKLKDPLKLRPSALNGAGTANSGMS